jgi:hypothetical protein
LLLVTCQARAETPDTITLTDGEQLIGKLVKVLSGAVTFHSDILGDVTVPLEKVKTLQAAAQFAVVEKKQHFTRKTAAQAIPVGAIAIEDGIVHVSPPKAEEKTFPAKNVNHLIDAASFNRELHGEQSFLYNWNGAITLGASLVDSTNSAQTYTGLVNLVRAIPATGWLPASSKTTLNLSSTYGLARDAQIVSNSVVIQPASVTKTDILHGGLEYDKYFSPAVFTFVNAGADHNLGSGLQLQQAYGGGIGWTVLNKPKNALDLKASALYEQQQFYGSETGPSGSPNKNLIAGAINETWKHNFPHNVKFNEYLTLTPTFNVAQAYSAVAGASLLFPAYKRLNFTLASIDNYIGDPPEGFKRNTIQFTAGVTYVVK